MVTFRKFLVKECLICGFIKVGYYHRSKYRDVYTYEQLREGVISKLSCPVCGNKSLLVRTMPYDEIAYKAREIRMFSL